MLTFITTREKKPLRLTEKEKEKGKDKFLANQSSKHFPFVFMFVSTRDASSAVKGVTAPNFNRSQQQVVCFAGISTTDDR